MKKNARNSKVSNTIGAAIIGVSVILSACSSYDPVPVSDCGKVVKHAKKVLKEFAPSHAEMTKDCKAATDTERGCIMAATKKGQILQCM